MLLGRVPGRRSDAEITIYKSLGVTTQDLAAAHLAWREAHRGPSGSRSNSIAERAAQPAPSTRSTARISSSTTGSSMVAGTVCFRPSGRSRASWRARSLPERVRQPRHDMAKRWKLATGPTCRAPARPARAAASRAGRDPAFQHRESHRHRALEFVGDADHCALGDRRVTGEGLLEFAGGEPMAGDVDDVVDPSHDEPQPSAST